MICNRLRICDMKVGVGKLRLTMVKYVRGTLNAACTKADIWNVSRDYLLLRTGRTPSREGFQLAIQRDLGRFDGYNLPKRRRGYLVFTSSACRCRTYSERRISLDSDTVLQFEIALNEPVMFSQHSVCSYDAVSRKDQSLSVIV